MQFKKIKLLSTLIIFLTFCTVIISSSSCGFYGFREKSLLPDSIKTVRVHFIANEAAYVNPQLSPNLTEKLRQRIITQTRLIQTNSDNAHYDIRARITEYAVTTTGVTSTNGQPQTSINRLTVSVAIQLTNQLNNKTQDYTVSRSFDFSSRLSIQAAEASLLDEMIRNLSDEIFNRIFSDW